MVKHTQTICRLLLKNCLSVFDHFEGLALKGLVNTVWPKKLSLIEPFTKSFPLNLR